MALHLMFYMLVYQFLVLDAKIPAIIVFGDSSVDSGNNNCIKTVLKANFRPYGRDFEGGKPTGRFSNGRVPTDFLAEFFGVKETIPAYLDPAYGIQDFATGVCFASAGTGYDNATARVLSVIPLWKELEYYEEYQTRLRRYLGMGTANTILSEALYIISLGTNDFLENYYALPERRSQFTVEEYENFLANIARTFIREIYELGARKISLTGLPPMGCLPLERTTNLAVTKNEGCIDRYNKVAVDFNGKLSALVAELNRELSRIQLVLSNPYDTLYDIISNPQKYGFENAATACCGTGLYEMGYLCNEQSPFTCSDANKFVFWDSFHPSEKTNGILAEDSRKTSLSVFQ